MRSFISNASQAKSVIVLFWIYIIMQILLLISCSWAILILSTLRDGGNVADRVIDNHDLYGVVVAICSMVVYIAAFVLLVTWTYRAYKNLHMVINNLQHGKGWAIGGWFCPILLLWRPYQIIKEMYVRTSEMFEYFSVTYNISKLKNTGHVVVWWTFWITANFYSNLLMRLAMNADTIDTLLTYNRLLLFGKAFEIVVALFTIKVVKTYASAEAFLPHIVFDPTRG